MVEVGSSGKSVFAFSSVGHFFAAAFSDLQKACVFVEKVGASVASNAGTVEAITGLVPGVGSQAVLVERAAFSALGMVVAAVHATGAAASASGLNVPLDQATVQAFEQLIADCKSDLDSLGYKL
jgi:phage-related tail protein